MNQWRLSYLNRLLLIIWLLSLATSLNIEARADSSVDSLESEVYGPENLLKTLRTPFTTVAVGEEDKSSLSSGAFTLEPIAIGRAKPLTRNLLQERFHGPKLFLPSRLVLGQSAEFVIKGNPGSYAAIAMAESNKGAKPVFGHNVRLGADRKLVALGKIPEQGIISLFVEAPIQGDLIGLPLYFEAVIWSNPDFSDMQIASTISPIENSASENGVLVSGQEEKKERAVVFDVSKPMSMQSVGAFGSSRP